MAVAISAIVTAAVLVAGGTEPLVAVAAGAIGWAVGGLTSFVLALIAMGFSAEEAGYGRVMGLSENDSPTLGYQLVGYALVLVPVPAAIVATLGASSVVAGVDRGVVLGGLVAVVGIAAVWAVAMLVVNVRESAQARARAVVERQRWLIERDASAQADPEFAAALLSEGWRPDGPYDEMRAAYFRAWEQVKATRRAERRRVFDPPEPPTG